MLKKFILNHSLIILLFLPIIVITILDGCVTVVQNRDFINDGNSTKYKLSSYHSLDSTVNSYNCDTVVSLERSGCLGKCPVFKLSLLSNGSVYFQGRHNVNRIGIYDTLLNKPELKKLVSEFNSSCFFRLRDKYDLNTCVGLTDLSSIVISVRTNKVSKRVSFYIGCIDYHNEARLMTSLAKKIEDISNVKTWIK
jgi:hypothetical protein